MLREYLNIFPPHPFIFLLAPNTKIRADFAGFVGTVGMSRGKLFKILRSVGLNSKGRRCKLPERTRPVYGRPAVGRPSVRPENIATPEYFRIAYSRATRRDDGRATERVPGLASRRRRASRCNSPSKFYRPECNARAGRLASCSVPRVHNVICGANSHLKRMDRTAGCFTLRPHVWNPGYISS